MFVFLEIIKIIEKKNKGGYVRLNDDEAVYSDDDDEHSSEIYDYDEIENR